MDNNNNNKSPSMDLIFMMEKKSQHLAKKNIKIKIKK